jgi:hypothetical protein
MADEVGLKDERPTSNIQRPTPNEIQTYNTEYSATPRRGFFSTIFMICSEYSSSLSFQIICLMVS